MSSLNFSAYLQNLSSESKPYIGFLHNIFLQFTQCKAIKIIILAFILVLYSNYNGDFLKKSTLFTITNNDNDNNTKLKYLL